MKWRINVLLVAASVMATAAGCEGPKDMAPVAPPGFDISRAPKLEPGEGAQAIGEQASVAPTTKQNTVQNSTANSPPTPIGQPTKTASGLIYETLKEGTGATARSGQTVTIHYTGTLADGKVFDSSPKYVTSIGTRNVIAGWDEGVPGMKVGERRKLTIPPDLAYGERGSPPDIPPGATLTFDVELLDVK